LQPLKLRDQNLWSWGIKSFLLILFFLFSISLLTWFHQNRMQPSNSKHGSLIILTIEKSPLKRNINLIHFSLPFYLNIGIRASYKIRKFYIIFIDFFFISNLVCNPFSSCYSPFMVVKIIFFTLIIGGRSWMFYFSFFIVFDLFRFMISILYVVFSNVGFVEGSLVPFQCYILFVIIRL